MAEGNPHFRIDLLPSDDLFPTLLADPRAPVSSLKYASTTNRESVMGKVSAGAVFGLIRVENLHAALQLNIEGGIFSRFVLQPAVVAETVDYRLGFSLSVARPASSKGWALQISPYHTSSHLLDDFIFEDPTTTAIKPDDYSREVIRMLVAYRFSPLNRIYAGGQYAFDGIHWRYLREYQAGSELFSPGLVLFGREFRLYLAEDLQAKEETNWNLNLNLQAGVSIRRMDETRGLRFAVEYFAGNAFEGQFSQQKEQNIGLAALFDL
jgi:Protein of unknown function (DUF1207)